MAICCLCNMSSVTLMNKSCHFEFCEFANSIQQRKYEASCKSFFWVFGLDAVTTKCMLFPKMRSGTTLTNKMTGWPCGKAGKSSGWLQPQPVNRCSFSPPASLVCFSASGKQLGNVSNKTSILVFHRDLPTFWWTFRSIFSHLYQLMMITASHACR